MYGCNNRFVLGERVERVTNLKLQSQMKTLVVIGNLRRQDEMDGHPKIKKSWA